MLVRDRDLGRVHVHVHVRGRPGSCKSRVRGLVRVRLRDHRDRQEGGEETYH